MTPQDEILKSLKETDEAIRKLAKHRHRLPRQERVAIMKALIKAARSASRLRLDTECQRCWRPFPKPSTAAYKRNVASPIIGCACGETYLNYSYGDQEGQENG